MARLPVVGGDGSAWGTVLNSFLQVAHNADGSLIPITYNVKNPAFGALGTGGNDTAAFVAASSALSSAGGGTLFIPAGNYGVNADWTPPSNTRIIGEGRATTITLLANNATNGIKLSGVSHVIISDLQINGNRGLTTQPSTQYLEYSGIWMTNCDDIIIERCYIHDCWSSGIMANGSCTNLIFIGNRLYNCWDNQIYVRANNLTPYAGCSFISISNNVCNGGGFSGIQLLGSSYAAITGNECYNNGPTEAQGDGIGSEGGSYITITGNECHGNGIQGVNIRGTLEMGATPVRSAHIVVANNTIYNHTSSDGDGGGISLTDCDDVLCDSNITENNYFGINITDVMNGSGSPGETNITLRGNKVRNNTNGGIRLFCANASTFVFEGNEVTDTGNGNPNIRANQRVWVKGGISARATGSGIPEGIALDNGASGSVIDGVSLFDNADNAILVGGSTVANVVVKNCTFDNVVGTNQNRALYESSGCGPTQIIDCTIQNQNFQDFSFSNASSVARNNQARNTWKDQNSGTATVPTSGTSVTVTHNLWTTPTRVEITATSDTLGNRFWISAKGATTFTISTNTAPGSNVTFDWRAWTWDS